MGIIQRQSIKATIVNYLGAVVGAFAALFVYTSNDEIYGYAQWLYGTATLFIPFASLGILALVIRYFPKYSNAQNGNYNGFLSLISIGLLGSFAIFIAFFYLFRDQFYGLLTSLNMNPELLETGESYVMALLFFLILLHFLTNQASNNFRIVVPNIIQQFGYRIFLPLLILAYAYFQLSQNTFSLLLISFFAASCLAMIAYLWSLKGIKFGKIRRPSPSFSYKEMVSYAIYGSLNQIGSGLAFRLDAVMIPLFMVGTDNVSFYFKAFIMASIIEMPTRTVNQIASPIIAKAWEEKDMNTLKTIYKKASLNLFLFGSFIFLGVWYCIPDLVNISADPTKFPHVQVLFLLLGLSKLIDMITSVNGSIIGYSDLYKYNLVFLLILGMGNLWMNIKLIPIHGIVGAAIATSVSLLIYNLLKLILISYKLKIHPFSTGILKSLILFTGIFGLSYLIPFNFNPFVNLLVKSIFVTALYLPIAYFWNISSDVNQLVLNIKNAITSKLWS